MTLYEDLDVNKDATKEEIKKAYRKKASKYHPDRNKDENAKSKFQKIETAYSVLKDDDKRKRYDKTGNYSNEKSETEIAIDLILQIFYDLFQSNNFKDLNYKKKVKEFIINKQHEAKKDKASVEFKLKKIERISKNAKDIFLSSMFEKLILEEKNKIDFFNQAIKILETSINILEKEIDFSGEFLDEISKNSQYETIDIDVGGWR